MDFEATTTEQAAETTETAPKAAKAPKAKVEKVKKAPQNVAMSMEGTTIVLKIDPSKDLGKSKSGKTTLIGTTAGEFVYNGVCLNVNVYRKP